MTEEQFQALVNLIGTMAFCQSVQGTIDDYRVAEATQWAHDLLVLKP